MSPDLADLWRRYKERADLRAREALLLAYLPLVRYVAGRLSIGLPSHVDPEDLESYGLFGLIEAVERFDPARGTKFETYALPRVRGAILDGIRAETWAPALRQRARQLEEAYARLEADLGRSPTDAELAAYLGITPEELARREAEVGASVVVSLEESGAQAGEGQGPLGRLADESAPDPVQEALESERREVLARAVERLSEKERLVITLYYHEGLTTKEIAAVLGVTPARVSQLHSKAILRLRGRLSRLRSQLISP